MASMENDVGWQYLSADETVAAFSTDGARGLKSAAVSHRRVKFGNNDLWKIEKTPFRTVAVKYLLDGAVALLFIDLLCAAFAGFDWQFALMLIITVAFVAVRVSCDVILSHLAENGAKSVIPETLVIRDGGTKLVPAVDLVPGDVVLLTEGDLVPADLRVIYAEGLIVSEKGITNNDIPVEKTSDALVRRPSSSEPESMSNMLFAFSYVLSGSARCVCAATGNRTLAASEGKKRTLSAVSVGPAQKERDRFLSRTSSAFMVAAMIYIFIGLFAFKGKFTVTGVFLSALSFAVAGFGTVRYSLMLFSHTRAMARLFRADADVRSPDILERTDECSALLVRDVSELTSGDVKIMAAVTRGKSFDASSLDGSRDLFRMLALASGVSSMPTALGATLDENRLCRRTIEAFLSECSLTAAELTSGASLAAHSPRGNGNPFDTAIWVENGSYHAVCAGDLARILSVCRTVMRDGFEETLSAEWRSRYLSLAKELEDKGCRVTAVAHRIPPTENFSHLAVIQNQMEFAGFVAVRPVPAEYTAQTVREFSSPERTFVCFASSHGDAMFALEDKMVAGASLREVKNAAEAGALHFEKGKNYVVCIPQNAVSADDRVKLTLALARRLRSDVGEIAFVGRTLADGVLAREAKVRICASPKGRLRPVPYSLSASADALCLTKEESVMCAGVCELTRSSDKEKRHELLRKYLIGSQIGRALLFAASLFVPPVIPAVSYLVWGLVLDTAVGAYILRSRHVGERLARPEKAHDRRKKTRRSRKKTENDENN